MFVQGVGLLCAFALTQAVFLHPYPQKFFPNHFHPHHFPNHYLLEPPNFIFHHQFVPIFKQRLIPFIKPVPIVQPVEVRVPHRVPVFIDRQVNVPVYIDRQVSVPVPVADSVNIVKSGHVAVGSESVGTGAVDYGVNTIIGDADHVTITNGDAVGGSASSVIDNNNRFDNNNGFKGYDNDDGLNRFHNNNGFERNGFNRLGSKNNNNGLHDTNKLSNNNWNMDNNGIFKDIGLSGGAVRRSAH